MKTKERLELAHWVVKEARKVGADDVSVNIGNYRTVEIDYRDSKLDQLKEATQNSLSLAIYTDNRYTSHSTNDLRKESLPKFVSEAVAMTKYLSEDPFRKLPDPKYYEGRKSGDLKLYDETINSVTSEKRVAIARELEELTRQKNTNIIACTSGYSDSIAESVKVNSNGFEGAKRSTSFSCGVSSTMKDESGGRPEDWSWVTTRNFDSLPTFDSIADECVRRNLQKIGQTKLETGQYTMLVENRTASRLLGGLIGPLSGRSIQQKNSFLDDKLGQKIASDKFSIIDDPFIEKGMGSRYYDGEGITSKKRLIIEKGVVKSFFIDSYYGRKLDMEPTSGSSSNLVFEYGDKSLEEMTRLVDKGILVTSFVGGNSNSTSGDFSYGIVGLYIEKGKIIKPVNEMNISGNNLEFWNSLIEVGNDPYIYSSYRRPSLLFENIQFSGK